MNGAVNGSTEESVGSSPHCSPVHKSGSALPEDDLKDCTKNGDDTENGCSYSDSEPQHEVVQQPEEHCQEKEDKESLDQPAPATEEKTEPTVEQSCNKNNEPENENKTNEDANEEATQVIDIDKKDLSAKEPAMTLSEANDGSEKSFNKDDDNSVIEDIDEVFSELDSSDDDVGSVISGDIGDGETYTINSDSENEGGDEASQTSHSKSRNSDVIVLDNDRSESQNGSADSPEVTEIITDNEDENNEEKSNSSSKPEPPALRRSSRTIKRKYDIKDDLENGDFESDVEEVEMEDPLSSKSKPIVISNTKTLIEMASKKMKTNNNRKEPTVVYIDIKNKGQGPVPSSDSVQELYQSIAARGTTVTPVTGKPAAAAPIAAPAAAAAAPPVAAPAPPILPSLTDDMFVVEAPSFIVPYVYEKPSVKPFREFVDTLGKELEEQKAKEEAERLEKEKVEKEKRAKERQERRDRGEEVEDSEDEAKKVAAEAEKKRKRVERRERRRRREDDDASWDGDSSSGSDDEPASDDDAVGKDSDADFHEKPVTDKPAALKSDSYFDLSLGKFFINIGLNMVQEYVQHDLLKQQTRKLSREKKSGQNTRAVETSIAALKKNFEFSKENNAPYKFKQQKCSFCSFKTESTLVMGHHLETPHMKNNLYTCNYCSLELRSPHNILYHMETDHKIRGRLERAPSYHQCPNCAFEDNGKGKLARHQPACAKKFKPDVNLAPPVEWEPPAKIPKISRARNNMPNSYPNMFNRQMGNSAGKPAGLPIANMMPGNFRGRGKTPAPMGRGTPLNTPMVRGSGAAGLLIRHNTPALNYPIQNNVKKTSGQPSLSITPLPRQPQPVPAPQQSAKSTFVICEICDGYIKDLEQLRNHMQWIHKVKIHPKMIYNRPPLNCQKCQFRFFTDQGLERHLLGSHGLVTSSMQEAANKGKDAGRCPVCGRVYQWKLLNHVARDHNLTLKPAHLSYKCTVCTATFGMYKQFENHVYSAHSVVAKRVMDKGKTTTQAKTDSTLKPLKINDEITIIPQPVKSAATTSKGK